MDWTKTILEAANCDDLEGLNLDGINLKAFFKEPSKTNERILFWRITNRKQEFAIRKGNFKYLRNNEGEFLFKLDVDISESMDLKNIEPNTFKQLKLAADSLNITLLKPDEYK
ncbi:hypothetical protein [Winogradskyella sp.]|nr:hypothetical protein [Winogradskyella sp.]MBO6881035.1 hypothetical protein [Winogradskyella sp.]